MVNLTSWPFVGRNEPFQVARAEGAYLYTPDNKPILDAAGGAIVVNIGHGRQEVAEVIRDAAMNCSYAIPPWMTPEREALVEELTTHWLPPHLSRIHLACGGSEANESALKMAIQYHAAKGNLGKSKIIARNLSYHGATIITTGLSGHAHRKLGLESILMDQVTIETPYPLRCPIGRHHPDATDYYIKNLEDTISKVGAENIAALIAEPIVGTSGGAITPPIDYWPRTEQVLKDNDILLIMDEVMTGFGRMGEKFCSDHYGIDADLLVAGKGMASGYAAIAGVYGKEEIAETISDSPFDVMFHTFGALPLSCAAATCVLQILRRENLIQQTKESGARLLERLNKELGEHPHVAEIRGKGLLIGIEIVKDRETLEQFPIEASITNKIVGHSLREGVFFYPGGTGVARDIVCIGAPFIIGEEEIEKIVVTLVGAVNEATGQ